jgi:DNA-binding HxlR family transcriptional regulator
MDQLPSSIEAYLEEAGFSGTEILILRRLMDGEPLTIRQLGAKTGKSTGVLDQAMKKLIKKNIIKKTLVNESPKYSLDSMESVVEWMQDDMEQKRDMLLRRHQNFESFVTSLESGSKRPDIEYFEGEVGIKQAYIKLLNGPGEIFHYLPVTGKEEEDPLRDFRVQYFRERQHRKMFSRVLAHDNALGRRYQSRDAFEYRKTVLVPEAEYPFAFEKIITGDRIACFDHKAKTACVIRYPELADIEKTLFEAIWRQVQIAAATSKEEAQKVLAETAPEKIASSTVTMSQVREFFLSRKSIATLVVCALLAGVVTYGLYRQNVALNLVRIRERALSVASTAALQFNLADLEEIRNSEDVRKPEYAKIIHHLNRIRRENPGVTYIYLQRPTQNSSHTAFIADADSLDPYAKKDLNGDGAIDEMDHLSPPGELYNISDDPVLRKIVEQGGGAYANDEPYEDQWGVFISAIAPIYDEKGVLRAFLGVDIAVDQLYELTNAQFQFVLYFFVFFILFLGVRFMAFNRSLRSELLRILSGVHSNEFVGKKPLYGLVATLMILYWISFFAIYVEHRYVSEETGKRLMAVAATAASQFDPSDLDSLRFARDMNTPEYQRVFKQLNDIRDANPDITWIYILRPTENEDVWEFVADADSNVFLDEFDDYNASGASDPNEENVWPGMRYYSENQVFSEALTKSTYSRKFVFDQWGKYITGVAPIYFRNKLYVLGVDMEVID